MAVNREERSKQGVIVLTPTDELLTAEVVQEIHGCIDSSAMKHAIIDLRAIHSLVSGSLYPHAEPFKPLLRIFQQLQQDGRRLVLCQLNREIADVFQIMRLDHLFEIQAELATALSSLGEYCQTQKASYLCSTNIAAVKEDAKEKLEFYCAVCEDFFVSHRDDTGYDQAPCPKCGDLSNTPDFYSEEFERGRRDKQEALSWVLQIILAFVVAIGGVWALLDIIF